MASTAPSLRCCSVESLCVARWRRCCWVALAAAPQHRCVEGRHTVTGRAVLGLRFAASAPHARRALVKLQVRSATGVRMELTACVSLVAACATACSCHLARCVRDRLVHSALAAPPLSACCDSFRAHDRLQTGCCSILPLAWSNRYSVRSRMREHLFFRVAEGSGGADDGMPAMAVGQC